MIILNKYILTVFVATLLWFPIESYAQKITVPIEMQLQIIPKIISLDKNLNLVDESKVANIAIIYSSKQRNSYQINQEILNHIGLQKLLINDTESKILAFDIAAGTDLREFIKQNNIKILYITPLRGINISELTDICKELAVLSVTGVEDYLENNVSVILTMEANKLKININLQSAKLEGSNFSSRLLRLANVI